jgi:hypothetical protein
MKKALTFVLCFASFATHAFDGFRCIPSLRETRIQVLVREKEVELRVTNAGGYKFMPQFDGPTSVFNLAFHKMQGEDLEGLGEVFIYSWPKDKCQVESSKYLINCQGEAQQKVSGISSYGISTTEILERAHGESYEKRRFRLNVENGNIYFVSLEYFTQNCETFN